MPRPRKNQEGLSAKQRLAEAFWKSLEEKPYSSITVSGLSKEAHVNPNTFYYYYSGLDNMAKSLFVEDLAADSDLILSVVLNGQDQLALWLEENDGNEQAVASMEARFRKASLLLNSGSTYLADLFKDELLGVWEKKYGYGRSNMSEVELMELNFIFDGIIGLYRSLDMERPLRDIFSTQFCAFLQTPVGKAVQYLINTMIHGGEVEVVSES
ncbi:MAG: TetR/AcrR family transcriptional regulator [Eggerthellaceae bacterium]|nr:TetR/AcrR family transcriptional regulator [Eggerthellaceae bacterium]